jgi:HAMP domain-containing protein
MLTFISGVLVLISSLFAMIFGSMALLALIVVGLAVAALYIWVIFSILFSNKSLLEKVLWVIFVLVFPLIGLLAWVLVGRNLRPLITTSTEYAYRRSEHGSDGPIDISKLDEDQLRDIEEQLAAMKRKERSGDAMRKSLDWNRDEWRRS